MNFMLLLNVFLLTVVIVLPILMIIALLVPKKGGYRDRKNPPRQSNNNRPGLRNTVAKMLVMRPWPYKDIYNRLSRNYWPDEQPDNRAGRRSRLHSRKMR